MSDPNRANWLRLVYGSGYDLPQPQQAAQMLAEDPALSEGDPWLACAAGNEAGVRPLLAHPDQPGGPLGMPPLVAVTFSSLTRLDEFAPALLRCAQMLLDAGADVNQGWIDPAFPDSPLSALYGAAGKNHNVPLTRLLLERGARLDDNESLYHSLESDNLACARLLLEAGADPNGTNALCRVLDFDNLPGLQLLLEHGADPNEKQALLHAIRRGRSARHAQELLKAGAHPAAGTYRIAMQYGRPEIAALLPSDELTANELFIAACADGDRTSAAKLNRAASLSPEQLQMLPNLASAGCSAGVRVMVEMGWPIETRGGDLDGSALNYAVFRGDTEMTGFLLAHGADWRGRHAYNDNVVGTLSYASRNELPGDFVGCAKALVESGMPVPSDDYTFSPAVEACFSSFRRAALTGKGRHKGL